MSIIVGIAAVILAFSLVPSVRIVRLLHGGATRWLWMLLTGLIVLFIAGYGVYLFGNVQLDGIVSFIFLFGSIFVFGTVTLSLQTIRAVQRISTLEKENITDSLMEIFNRRYFDRRIDHEFSRARRYGQSLSLIIFDLDCFKKINDTWGHPAGDEVLRKIGEVLRISTRETDIPARMGGDEVAVILPSEDLSGAQELGRRILEAVKSTEFVHGIRCTVSVGVVELNDADGHYQDLVERADRAMYTAKREGRGCVIVADGSASTESA